MRLGESGGRLGQQLLNGKRDPMAARKGRRECIVGIGGTGEHGKNATNRRAENCIVEKEFTKSTKLLVVMGTRVVCRSEL
jgi:hypothetical protein